MIDVYADTSVLAKLYVNEPNSPDAVRLVGRYAPPFPVVPLHLLELRNALRLKAFRGEITMQQLQQSLADVQSDIHAGRLSMAPLDWDKVYQTAEAQSAQWAVQIGCRSLDALHVGAACVLGCRTLLTFDERQAGLARKAGLKVVGA